MSHYYTARNIAHYTTNKQ